jgi:hypothetical protein
MRRLASLLEFAGRYRPPWWARPALFLAIAALTVAGVLGFALGDESGRVLAYWLARGPLIPALIVLAILDAAFECLGWLWTYRRLGIRCWDPAGAAACLTSRAGFLLPAQTGRLLRPDAMARLERAPLGRCLRAEAAAFVFDATSAGALIVGLIAWKIHWALAPVAVIGCILSLLFVGNRIAARFSETDLMLPPSFWWSWQSVGTVLVQMIGWVIHGVGLWLMIRGLTELVTLTDTVLFATAAAVLGASTGLPGGLLATEGLLGISLSTMRIPPEHLAVAVGSFRILTFWIWIPIGWVTLLALNRHVRRRNGRPSVIVEPTPEAVAATPSVQRILEAEASP